jgi:uncharacterized protein (TIGR02145 family)
MKIPISILAVIILIMACDKNSNPDPVSPLTDIDGNGYDTIKISTQFWMQQNLTTSHYRNGDPIPEITSISLWSSLSSGAWCWYNNDSIKYAAIYGKLYNWYAVNDPRGLAPEGWHVPAYNEWVTLSTSLGGDILAGDAMKEAGTTHWEVPNAGAANSSGFTGLPGGYCNMVGIFETIGQYGVWWSSSEITSTFASYRYLNYSISDFSGDSIDKHYGFSVRCLRD